ncbi:MAG: apolipoprotein N-acyltransferase [Bradyrhizobium sp.]|nr:apolipoprotein N-acyltransferase [Bradyrhizobium sp.]
MWLIDSSPSTRSAFATGWWFGLGHFVLGLYWIAEALLIDPQKFGWMIPFAVFGLSGGLALFPALAVAVTHRCGRAGVSGVLILSAAWTTAEWLRGHILTGFPWNLIGYVWTLSDGILQLAAVTGIYGLSLITVVAAAMPAVLATQSATRPSRRGWLALGAVSLLLAVIWIAGSMRLSAAGTKDVPGVRLRIVQPDIPQIEKWSQARAEDHFERLLRLSKTPEKEQVTDVIWPETAVPFTLNADVARAIGAIAPPDGLVITGAVAATQRPGETLKFWNSVVAIDASGNIRGIYDKFHLVPFGEYMPLRKYLPLDAVAAGPVDFSAGPGPRTLYLPGLPAVSPLVCYEAIFPGAVVASGSRPAWLLNVTNDAWFGRSAGPYQHFAIAKTRAVEEGLPLVRAANTGISAVVDPYGRVLAHLGLGEKGVLDSPLPAAAPGLTPYARYGDRVPMALLVLTALMGWILPCPRVSNSSSACSPNVDR